MRREEFESGLRELDDAYAQKPLPAGLEGPFEHAGVRRAIGPGPTWVAIVGLAALAALVLVWRLNARPSVGGFTVEASRGALTAEVVDGAVRARGSGQLVDEPEQVRIEVDREAQVSRIESGSRIVSGAATYEVAHRKPGQAPYRVRTSHGVIEVMGTRFSVVQRAESGQVTLQRGAIQFRGLDGRVWPVAVGETFQWPPPQPAVVPEQPRVQTPEVPAPVPEKAKKADHRPAPPEPQPEPVAPEPPILDEVAALRSRGEYQRAAQLLSRELSRALPDSTDERLSFELGTILTHQLHDVPRACAHWARHAARHPGGRYAADVAAAMTGLGCSR
jgi:transmembrane sensor